MEFTLTFINVLFEILSVAIIVRIFMSWLRVGYGGKVFQFVHGITEPLLLHARKITPKIGMLDISPIIALIALDVIKYILLSLISSI